MFRVGKDSVQLKSSMCAVFGLGYVQTLSVNNVLNANTEGKEGIILWLDAHYTRNHALMV